MTTFLSRMNAGVRAFRAAYKSPESEGGYTYEPPKPMAWSYHNADEAWLATVDRIMSEGNDVGDRTGVGTRSVFGHGLKIPLTRDGRNTLPVVSIKKTGWKTAIGELQWMLSGSNQLQDLLKKNIKIWSEWPHAKYNAFNNENMSLADFEKRILESNSFAAAWGVIEPCYGTQMRNFAGRDQMQMLVDGIKNNPSSRRLIWSLWEPEFISISGTSGLPPCHYRGAVNVVDGVLSLEVGMRSWDVGLGGPFNIAQYGWFAHVLAELTGNKPGDLLFFASDTHLYQNHIDILSGILDREPKPDPFFNWIKKPTSLDDLSVDDFSIEGYDPHPFLPMPVAV